MLVEYKNHVRKTIQGRFDLFRLTKSHPHRYPYLLESTAQSPGQNSPTARYDILLACPKTVLKKSVDGGLYLNDTRLSDADFLDEFDHLWHEEKVTDIDNDELPFIGGWFIYLSYELVAEIEPGLQLPVPEGNLPVAMAVRIPVAIVYDHDKDETSIVAEKVFADEIEQTELDLVACGQGHALSAGHINLSVEEESAEQYTRSIDHIHHYIREGDVFQVNLSRRWHGKLPQQYTHTLYENLRVNNPAPFAGFINLENGAILSSSPERLVSARNGRIDTRPIAGTRPRGGNSSSDTALQQELIGNIKERAEHVMLIDLERNDLGRVCRPGTIRVDEQMIVETYAHVHHIVSNVCGQIKEQISPTDIIRAVFPGGTITGCPKVRCMEIIAELEKTPRGAYTGSMGYIGHDGRMDLNILIRSIIIDGDDVSFRAGAGVVADSVAGKELEETRSKAKGLLLAMSGDSVNV